MSRINIELNDHLKSKEGDLLVFKGGKWIPTSFKELNKENEEKLAKFDELNYKFETLAKNNKHFIKFALSHFLVVYNYFKIKILSGEIDVTDEELLHLDEKILSGEIKVQDAIEMHPLLKETFYKLYLQKSEMIEFPEV